MLQYQYESSDCRPEVGRRPSDSGQQAGPRLLQAAVHLHTTQTWEQLAQE